MFTTSIDRPLKGLERADGNTEGSRNALGSQSGNWATTPTDCLRLIFETGLECTFPEDKPTKQPTNSGQLYWFISTVSQTCRWWRQVALETPRLWSTLILNDTTPLEMLETWLTRSKVAPLYIDLTGDLTPGSPVPTSLLPLLLEHIHRWSRLRYLSDDPQGLPTFLATVDGKDAPLLEKLSLGPERFLPFTSWPVSVERIFNGPDSVPKLVDVHLGSAWWEWRDNPFRNLRSLSLSRIGREESSYLGIEGFKDLLSESQQLNHLRLVGHIVRPSELGAAFEREDQAPQPISLPALNTLIIFGFSDPEQLNRTLRLIHAPNLKNLRLTNLASGGATDFAPTFEFLGTSTFSSFERLEALELRRVYCLSGAEWDHFCAKLTNIREISLSYMLGAVLKYNHGSTNYLESLALPLGGDVTEGGELRCGNLRTLSAIGWTMQSVVRTVEKRLKAGYEISRVIYSGSDQPHRLIDELAKLGVESRWYPYSYTLAEPGSGWDWYV